MKARLMMADESRYLGGAMVDGWEAPNITPDPIGGLGGWEVEDIVEYLKTGRAMGVVQAAGPMAEAVHYSTRHLTEDDLISIARYLKTVPALETPDQARPVIPPAEERPEVAHEYGAIRTGMAEALERTDLSATETLYLSRCAACHGVEGGGQPSAYYPALSGSSAARRENPSNLIMVLARGVKHSTLYRAPLMPGFENEMDAGQIADLGNYVRVRFGGFENSSLTASDVDATLNPEPDLPFLIEHAALLAWIAIVAMLCMLAAIIWLVWQRRATRVGG